MAQKANFVALVKVERYSTFSEFNEIPLSMEVEVIKTYKGKENRKIIKVWGDNGIQCRPYLSTFKVGQYYVIAFYSIDYDIEQSGEKKSDYFISVCGAYWLTIDFNIKTATGDIDSKNRIESSITLTKLESKLKKQAANIQTNSRKSLRKIATIKAVNGGA